MYIMQCKSIRYESIYFLKAICYMSQYLKYFLYVINMFGIGGDKLSETLCQELLRMHGRDATHPNYKKIKTRLNKQFSYQMLQFTSAELVRVYW